MKKKFHIGTSWKMNKSASDTARYLIDLKGKIPCETDCEIFVVVPYTALWKAVEVTSGSPIKVGAQNMHWVDEGPYTGEVSPMMLAEVGVQVVELAHSERRAYYNETDQDVNKKVHAALAHGLTPILCIGERQSDKDYGVSIEYLAIQTKIALHGLSAKDAERVWVAYEPVWAIGVGGTPAEPAYADAMQGAIRDVLCAMFGAESGSKIPILYGGSVNEENAVALAMMPHIDGLFIGRAGLDVDSFSRIIASVSAALA